jgi:hypothetical protein
VEKNLREQLNDAAKQLESADNVVKNAERLLNSNVVLLNSEQRKEIEPYLRMVREAKKCDDITKLTAMQNQIHEAIKKQRENASKDIK